MRSRLFSFSADRECVQRTAGSAEMPPGEMQIVVVSSTS